MSKNVSAERVEELNQELFGLQKIRLSQNDLEHFKRFEKFIKQEALSDQRFRVYREYDLSIPHDHIVVDSHSKWLDFIKRLKLGRVKSNLRVYEKDIIEIQEVDFNKSYQLHPGKVYRVTEYEVLSKIADIAVKRFLDNENAGLCGLSGISTVLELSHESIPKVKFFSPTIDCRKFSVDLSWGSLRVSPEPKEYAVKGEVILTMKEKL